MLALHVMEYDLSVSVLNVPVVRFFSTERTSHQLSCVQWNHHHPERQMDSTFGPGPDLQDQLRSHIWRQDSDCKSHHSYRIITRMCEKTVLDGEKTTTKKRGCGHPIHTFVPFLLDFERLPGATRQTVSHGFSDLLSGLLKFIVWLSMWKKMQKTANSIQHFSLFWFMDLDALIFCFLLFSNKFRNSRSSPAAHAFLTTLSNVQKPFLGYEHWFCFSFLSHLSMNLNLEVCLCTCSHSTD